MASWESTVISFFSVVSLVCFVYGCSIQDWARSVDVLTGGKHDTTWGTYVTDYILGIECLMMAMLAPGRGLVKLSTAAAYLAACICWTGGGLLHHVVPTGGAEHDVLWIAVVIGGGWASLFRAYAAILSAHESGARRCCA